MASGFISDDINDIACVRASKRCRRRKDSQVSDIPNIALFSVVNRLSIADFFVFGAVSTSWRSATKDFKQAYMASRPPLLMLHLPYPRGACWLYDIIIGDDLRFRETLQPDVIEQRCVGVSQGHLIIMVADKRRISSTVALFNPFSGAMVPVPYDLSSLGIRFGILTSPPAASDSLLLAWGASTVAVFRPGPIESIMSLELWPHGIPTSAVAIDGKVFALTRAGLVVMDLSSLSKPSGPEIELVELRPCIQNGCSRSGEEVVVTQLGGQPLVLNLWTLMAFRLDMAAKKWVKVVSLGDRALFASWSGCIVSEDPTTWGGQPNSIYYLDPYHRRLVVFSLDQKRKRGSLRKQLPNWGEGRMKIDGWVSPSTYYSDSMQRE